MQALTPLLRQITSCISEAIKTCELPDKSFVKFALGDGPNKELRKLVDIKRLRKNGAFFTTPDLREVFAKRISSLNASDIYFDPTCGAGDLLLVASSRLPVYESLTDTLKLWSRHLMGIDRYGLFVNLSKARLVLEALRRGARSEDQQELAFDTLFPYIRRGNALLESQLYLLSTVILANPPYGPVLAPSNNLWAKGKVTHAAIFVDHILNSVREETRVITLLPEVLRSGTRYSRWRQDVGRKVSNASTEVLDQFDKFTDIHVFILDCIASRHEANQANYSTNGKIWPDTADCKRTIGSIYKVSVGSVVPYRDIAEGTKLPYLHPKNTPAWKQFGNCQETRKHNGKKFIAPFVVVRRTSRPGDKYRAVATLITGKQIFAIENHLLVIQPLDKRLSSCKALMRNLRDPRTTTWLDGKLRCRHLTVSVLRQLPIWEAAQHSSSEARSGRSKRSNS